MQIFNNSEFGQIRTIEHDGEPRFVGKDVAVAMGYNDTDQSLRKHVDDEDKLTRRFNGSVQNRSMTIINESGLYSLVLSSKLPTAKAFKRWITHKVLPSIRKTGTYSINPERKALAEAKLNNSRTRVSSMWMKIAEKVSVPEYQNICARYGSKALAGHEVIPLPEVAEYYFTATEIGSLLGVSSQKIGKIANEHGMKTGKYGKTVWDKSRYSAKQVEKFRYNEKAVQRFRELLEHIA